MMMYIKCQEQSGHALSHDTKNIPQTLWRNVFISLFDWAAEEDWSL